MKKEELFKMQLGDYSLTDGIYNYEMEISLTNDSGVGNFFVGKSLLLITSPFLFTIPYSIDVPPISIPNAY